MARITYLERRGATYYARIDIPLDLVQYYGTTTRKKSLHTKDENEAKVLLWPVIELWRTEFDDIRNRRELTADNKADAVWQHYTGTIERDEQARHWMPTETDVNAAVQTTFEAMQRNGTDIHDPLALFDASLDVIAMKNRRLIDREARRIKLDHLRKHLAQDTTDLIDHEVDIFIDDNQLIIDPELPDRTDLARQMMRAEIEALQRTLERDSGDYTGAPKDPIVKPATGRQHEQAKPGETVMELFEVYARENPKGITTDALNQARRDISLFLEVVGIKVPINQIDKKAVREWKALLMLYPVKASQTKAFAGMKMPQIVKHNEKIKKPVIVSGTINRHLAGLGAFCRWLVHNGYLDNNPTDGMYLAKDKKKKAFPFTIEQLNIIFKSPIFAGCQSVDKWSELALPGNIQIRDHRYWIPLVMLYSGARPGEIAQLALSDVRQEHGQWIMHITTEGDDEDDNKNVKTEGSMRVVPIHEQLVKLGFLDYHASMKQAKESRLFPLAKRNSRGQMIADFSREFGRYLTRIGVKTGRGLSLYSFRHGATDALRRAGHLDEQFGFILGHTASTMTGRYGIMPQGMLEQRVALIKSIAYPDLDLSHLETQELL